MTDDNTSTPPSIREAAELVTQNLLPDKSREKYNKVYTDFCAWRSRQQTSSLSEEVMLVYFEELSKTLKPSTLWAKYSMLKSTVSIHHHVDMYKYRRLTAFLSKNSKGFLSKKSNTLDPQHVEKFLLEAPDEKYLVIKVALILGITGACRREELKNITVCDIEHHNNMVVIKIPRTKTSVPRKFSIDGDFYKIFKKYEDLRPKDCVEQFLLGFRNGKCTRQVIGINTFGAMPKVIAEYLKLEQPERYTGHTFRRTSATMLADSGADLLTLKRHGGWKSDRVAMGYIEDSIGNKKKICAQICQSVNLSQQPSIDSLVNAVAKGKNIDDSDQCVFMDGSSIATTSNQQSLPASSNSNEISSASLNTKENVSAPSNSRLDETNSINLTNCQVTFYMGK